MIEERACANSDELPKLAVDFSKLFERVMIGMNRDPGELLNEVYGEVAG